MTYEQFIYWLSGKLEDRTYLGEAAVSEIKKKLATVTPTWVYYYPSMWTYPK